MSDTKDYSLYLNNIRENEQIILKLICAVSRRSEGRINHYSLVTNTQEPSDIVLGDSTRKNDSTSNIKALLFEAWLSDSNTNVTSNQISRPLIATRVLTALDRLVQEHLTSPIELETDEQETENKHPDEHQTHESNSIVFDISEEEASELAIVEDETLENPSNIEETMILDALPASILQFNKEDLTKSKQASNTTNDSIPRALVVDDSPSVRKQLELELDLFNVNVDFAKSAEEALTLIDTHHYQVAFLDVVLPDKDGFQICKQLKATSKNTAAIMLTGKATQSDKIKGSLAGCDAYLVKPVGRKTFQSAASKFLSLINQEKFSEA